VLSYYQIHFIYEEAIMSLNRFSKTYLIDCSECGKAIMALTFQEPERPNWTKALCVDCFNEKAIELTLAREDKNGRSQMKKKVLPNQTVDKLINGDFLLTLAPELADSSKSSRDYEVFFERAGRTLKPDENLAEVGIEEGDTLILRMSGQTQEA
jgi:hypothetical protein